jgi:phosphonate transport system ATP-binding protein
VAALGPLSLALRAGEQVAVIGPSGAGKTTLLHALACALRPAGGRLLLDDIDPWTLPATALRRRRSELFLAPQVPPLPARQRVVTAVLAGRLPHMGLLASLRSLVVPTDVAGAHAALARFDLADKLFERVDRLSGGERQRVGLARSLLAGARLLLVDEPLSALDPARAGQALQALTEAARHRGATLVCTLHDVSMAMRHFPRLIGLRDGVLQFDAPPHEVGAERLRALYHGHLEELEGRKPAALQLSVDDPPVVMHCR